MHLYELFDRIGEVEEIDAKFANEYYHICGDLEKAYQITVDNTIIIVYFAYYDTKRASISFGIETTKRNGARPVWARRLSYDLTDANMPFKVLPSVLHAIKKGIDALMPQFDTFSFSGYQERQQQFYKILVARLKHQFPEMDAFEDADDIYLTTNAERFLSNPWSKLRPIS